MTEFRERMIDSVSRIEANVKTLLERQEEDRETTAAALKTHTEQDLKNFDELREKQDKTSRLVNIGIGGVLVLQLVIGIAIALLK